MFKSFLLSITLFLASHVQAMSCEAALGHPQLREYLAQLTKTAAPLTSDESFNFVADPRSDKKASSLARLLKSSAKYVSEEDISLSKSFKIPQVQKWTDARGYHPGGLAIYALDVFPLDFFHRRHGDRVNGVLVTEAQPWFEWRAGQFTFHKNGGSKRLLSYLLDGRKQVSLFRGTTNYESVLLELARSSARGEMSGDWRAELQLALSEMVEHYRDSYISWQELVRDGHASEAELALKQKRYSRMTTFANERLDQAKAAVTPQQLHVYAIESLRLLLKQSPFFGIFTTDSRERAADFSKGQVIEFSFTADELQRLVELQQLFVGFEKIGEAAEFELGFKARGQVALVNAMLEMMSKHFVKSTPTPAGQLFN